MPVANRSAFDASPLRQRLAALRRRLYLVATIRGVGLLVTVLLATAVVAGVLDWRWHLPGLVRAVFLVAALAGAALVAVRYLFRPLTAKADDLALALQVEDQFPSLNDALASTVQFLNQPTDSTNDSASMRREAVRRTMGLTHSLDFNRVVDSRGLFSASLAMMTTAAVALLLLWIDPVLATTALVRFTNPFGKRAWPFVTQLDALEARYKNTSSPAFTAWLPLTGNKSEPSPFRVGKSYEYQIQGVVKGQIPKTVNVIFPGDSVSTAPSIHTCDVTLDEMTNTHRFSTKLRPDQVQHNFRFYIVANDNTTQEFKVEVLPPPMLVLLDGQPSPQLTLHYPRYTDLPSPQSLAPGTGNLEAIVGTGVTLRAKADRPLQAAWIEFVPEDKNVTFAAMLAPLGSAQVFGNLASLAGGQAVWDRVPARLDADPSSFTIEFLPRVHGTYVLHFMDETGLRNSRTFELRLRSDPAPVVQLERPSPARDVLQVLPDADLPLHVVADDPIFALRSVFLLYRTMRGDEPRRITLYDHATFAQTCSAPVGGCVLLTVPAPKLRPTYLEFRRTLSLKMIRHVNNWSLSEGDILLLQAGADDFDDVTLNKQPGLSHEVEIRIVGRNALEIELNREQAKVQQDLVRLREKEREALKLVTDTENKVKKNEKLNEEDIAKLLQAEQTQQQIHERVGDDKEGLRAEVSRILQTLKQNHLQNSAVKDRMQDVQRELDRLAENELETIEQRLAQARKQAELGDNKPRTPELAELEKQAKELTDKANAARKEVEKKLEQAFQNETVADRLPEGDAEKERLNAEVRKQRAEAAELQKKAEQWKRQAEQARNHGSASSQTRQLLDETRQHQEEVEKTLNDLLTRLEPWSSTREIKGEANKLLEEQRQMLAELEKLSDKKRDFLGRSFDELSPNQRQELAELQRAQQQIEERTKQLLSKMDRISQDRATKDPETAKELQDARNQAVQDNITGQMDEARKAISDNQIRAAKEAQENAVQSLKKMVKTLEDRREAELDRLVKKMREAEQQLDELAKEQELLQKKVREAQNLTDPKEREEALKKLARQQKELQQKTQDMIKQLSRLRAERAGSALSKAGNEMEQAGDDLAQGRKADEKQEDVLDRLDEAQRELEQARQRAEEELRREQLARVEENIKRLRDRQDGLKVEAARIQTEAQQKKEWTRALTRGSLKDLAESQGGLGTETTDLAKKDLTATPVFAKLVQRSADTMKKAGERAQAMVLEPPLIDKLPDEELTRLQQDALRRLDQLLDAIKAETMALQRNANNGGGNGGEGGGGGGNGGDTGLPPLAQLKLLRAMQEDVNKRTLTFMKTHSELDKLTEKEKTELAGIRADQHDIQVLLEELRSANEPGDPEGDKK